MIQCKPAAPMPQDVHQQQIDMEKVNAMFPSIELEFVINQLGTKSLPYCL